MMGKQISEQSLQQETPCREDTLIVCLHGLQAWSVAFVRYTLYLV